LLLEKRGEAHG